MADYERATQQKQEDREQKHHRAQREPQPLADQFHAWDQGISSFTETPFQPRMDEHAELLSTAPSHKARASIMLRLQQTYGNRYVQRLVESIKVQAKLTVSSPNDVYEQEADRVAKAVTSGAVSQAQRQAEEEEEEEELQAKPISSLQRQEEEEEEELQTQPAGSQPAIVPEDLETRIKAARGSGHPLSDIVREPMQRAFGADFSGVRVHTDSEADALNQQLSARAFTTGQDVFFKEGEYSPGSDSGRELIAHELTHVVQQNGAGVQHQRVGKDELAQPRFVQRQDEGKEEEEGTLPPKKGAMVRFEGPDDRHMLDGRGGGSGTSTVGTATAAQAGGFRIIPGSVGFEFSDTETRLVEQSGPEGSGSTCQDALKVGSVGLEFNSPGNLGVNPFGAVEPQFGHKDLTWKRRKKDIKVAFTLDVNCPWGVADGGCTDVPSATAAVVTTDEHPSGKKVYEQIADDLTPSLIEKSWRAPRDFYWSRAICERHEKFHVADIKKWAKGPGTKVVKDYLKGQTIPGTDVGSELDTVMDNSITAMDNALFDFYTGGATSYLSYYLEERAFGDGKKPYQNLAKAVEKQGKKLEKAAAKSGGEAESVEVFT